jgi:hypothetical protein
MLVYNRSIYNYYLGSNNTFLLPAGSSLEVSDSAWSTNDQLARTIETLDYAGYVTVSNVPVGFPRTQAFPLEINIISDDAVANLSQILAAGNDAGGLQIKNLQTGTDPDDAAKVSQITGGGWTLPNSWFVDEDGSLSIIDVNGIPRVIIYADGRIGLRDSTNTIRTFLYDEGRIDVFREDGTIGSQIRHDVIRLFDASQRPTFTVDSQKIHLNDFADSGLEILIEWGDIDPGDVGLAAPIGSIYISSLGKEFRKTGIGNFAWSELIDSSNIDSYIFSPVQTIYAGQSALTNDGATGWISWFAPNDGAADILDRTDPLKPIFLKDGVYAISYFLETGNVSPGGFFNMNFAITRPTGPGLWNGVYEATDVCADPSTEITLSVVVKVQAGDRIEIYLDNEDGASPRIYNLVNAAIVKLS